MRRKNELYEEYFPFTNQCPVDGRDCVRNNICKLWTSGCNQNSCWYIDFQNLVFEIFDCDDSSYIYFKNEAGQFVEGLRHVRLYLDFNDKLDSNAIELEIRIGFNSHRLAEKIKDKFKLENWFLESADFEGGDDADLKTRIPGSLTNQFEIKDKLVEIRDKLAPEIIKSEIEINTCAICKDKSWILNEYEGKAICAICENRIIIENISKYC